MSRDGSCAGSSVRDNESLERIRRDSVRMGSVCCVSLLACCRASHGGVHLLFMYVLIYLYVVVVLVRGG